MWVQIPPQWEGAILMGKGESHCKVQGHSAVPCAKKAEPIEMPFRLWVWTGSRNHVLDGGPAVLRNVAMATNFGTQFAIIGLVGYNFGCMRASDTPFDSTGGFSGSKIAITGFVWTIVTRLLVMERGLSGRPTKCRYCRYTATKGRCHGNHLLAFYGGHNGATWQIRLNCPCVVAMWPCVKLLVIITTTFGFIYLDFSPLASSPFWWKKQREETIEDNWSKLFAGPMHFLSPNQQC